MQAASWADRQARAEAMIPIIGSLYRERSIVTSLHGRSLINRSAIDVLKAHRFARHLDETELPLSESLPIISSLAQLDLGAASIDVAQLAYRFRTDDSGVSLEDFLRRELDDIVGAEPTGPHAPRDVVLYGFGRIGRLVARILIEHGSAASGVRLRAIVVRRGSDKDLHKRASLLRRDSVHGPFEGTITVDEERDTILANGTLIQVIYSDSPSTVDYTAYGITDAIVVDNTGRWRDAEGLAQHLEAPGVARVLLTAPGKGELKNIVYGINHDDIEDDDRIVSAASCTTNAITPVLHAVDGLLGVVSGHVETVHSFTNDQNLIDNFHAGDRRGRSAALNMVITETGAAKAVAKALPSMAGKLTGSAIRVPTPDVSLAILNLRTERQVTREEINAHLRRISLDSPLRRQIDYLESPEIVSSDILGSRHAGVVDGLATIATPDGVILYVWYDNEFGYSCQVVRVLEALAGEHLPHFPAVREAAEALTLQA
ncbi:glyceraldehyde-3-phosphate dehydrogenase [Plantibacter flavus]